MIPTASALSGLMFLVPAVAISAWVAVSDMSRMKIPNRAVAALTSVYVVLGLALVALGEFTWGEYLWRFVHLVVVLLIGFVMNAAGLLGAGDAKFAAAMAPFVALGDLLPFAYLFAAMLLFGFVLHRVAKRLPFVRKATSDWESWERSDFPMGLCLGLALTAYLIWVAFSGA